mmetsp:Transcript_75423/g.157259  ORF Transcript_75423/g.157259 Transcript_75423/m.157259 type:complete len:409 (-) Transcript_75423:596-1822(-)
MESVSTGTDGDEGQEGHDSDPHPPSTPAWLSDHIPTLRRIAAALPLFACTLSLTTTLLSFLYSPNTQSQWDRLHVTGYNEVKNVWVVDEDRCHAFRIYQIVVYALASLCEGWMLKRAWASLGSTPLYPCLPWTFHMVNLYRPLIAVGNFVVLLLGADDPGVNPGLGLYGWTGAYSASGFPEVKGLNSWTHILLATTGGVTIALTRARPRLSLSQRCSPFSIRLFATVALCLTPEYFWYDSKHWFAGSHFANLSGEFLPWFSVVAALAQCALASRIIAAQVVPATAATTATTIPSRSPKVSCRWPWLYWFDLQGCVFAPICVAKTIVDVFRCPGLWEPPTKMPEEVPASCSFYLGSFDVVNNWRTLFLVIYFTVAAVLFIASEVRLRQALASPQCGGSSEAMELCGGND